VKLVVVVHVVQTFPSVTAVDLDLFEGGEVSVHLAIHAGIGYGVDRVVHLLILNLIKEAHSTVESRVVLLEHGTDGLVLAEDFVFLAATRVTAPRYLGNDTFGEQGAERTNDDA